MERFMNHQIMPGRALAWQVKLLLWILLLVFAGCAGYNANLTDLETRQELLTSKLPPLPTDEFAARGASGTAVSTIQGFDTWDNTAGTIIDGTNLILPASAGGTEWSMYRHALALTETSLFNLNVSFSAAGGDGAWIAASDYGHDRWALYGPYTSTQDISLTPGNFLSPMGHFYTLVIAFDGTTVDLTSTSLSYDDGVVEADPYAGPVRAFFAENCFSCHGVTTGFAGVVLESYEGAVAAADAAKQKVQDDHQGSYSTAEKEMIAAWADAGAPLGDAVRYTTDMLPQVFTPACNSCHASSLSGGARNGAPSSVNWDTYAAASVGNQPNRGNIRSQAGTMPPAGSGLSLSQAQKDLFQQWIDAGWPE
jgi:mono/diheme cytochrome c family protein